MNQKMPERPNYEARSISFPAGMWEEIDSYAMRLNTSRSELLRRAWQCWKDTQDEISQLMAKREMTE